MFVVLHTVPIQYERGKKGRSQVTGDRVLREDKSLLGFNPTLNFMYVNKKVCNCTKVNQVCNGLGGPDDDGDGWGHPASTAHINSHFFFFYFLTN